MNINPALCIDGYKSGHVRQYPENTTTIYSNLTPRSGKLSNLPGDDGKVVFFGLQYFIKDFLQNQWTKGFFEKTKSEVVYRYKRRMDNYLGPNAVSTQHIEDLHDLGYLPIEIRALPEGSRHSSKIPFLTIKNTLPDYFWLTNYLETILSCYLWDMCTAATTAKWYRDLLDKYNRETTGDTSFSQWQGHDFSFRGQSSLQTAMMSGAAHLLSFMGTDTIPAIDFLEEFYNADAEKELIGGSVPASEHSVASLNIILEEQNGLAETAK